MKKNKHLITTPDDTNDRQHFGLKTFLRLAITIVSVGFIAAGIYLLVLLFGPKYSFYLNKKMPEITDQNRVIVLDHGINTAIYEGGVEVLENGAWHQYSERGNPQTGGNFILAAHSFLWGYTPSQIMNKSFFYNLEDVKVGDQITVHWNKQAYTYTATEKFQIKPNDPAILEASGEAKLTMYTCTEAGSADGRVVVIAKPNN